LIGKTTKKRVKRKLVLFDSITRQSKNEKVSVWSGKLGTYVFKSSGKAGSRTPVSQVYLNREYFTGVFRTKDSSTFSGDIKEIDRKRYLIFKIVGLEKIDIFEKF